MRNFVVKFGGFMVDIMAIVTIIGLIISTIKVIGMQGLWAGLGVLWAGLVSFIFVYSLTLSILFIPTSKTIEKFSNIFFCSTLLLTKELIYLKITLANKTTKDATIASCKKPPAQRTPIDASHHKVAAVVSPLTLLFLLSLIIILLKHLFFICVFSKFEK